MASPKNSVSKSSKSDKLSNKASSKQKKSVQKVKEQPKQVFSVEEIKTIYQQVKTSTKNLNDIVKLLDQLTELSKSHNEILAHEEEARLLIISLLKVFEHFIKSKTLRYSIKKETNDNKVVLNKWLKSKYDLFKKTLLSLISEFVSDNDILIDALEGYFQLMKLEATTWAPKNEAHFPGQMYETLVKTLIFDSKNGKILEDGTTDSILIEFFTSNYLNKCKDLKFYFLSSMINLLEQEKQKLGGKSFKTVYSKWLTIMQEDYFHSIFYGTNDDNKKDAKIDTKSKNNKDDEDEDDFGFSDDDDDSVVDASDDEELELTDTFVPKPPQAIQKFATYKSLFTKNWLSILSIPGIESAQLKTTLNILHKRIIPYMIKPEQLMDFLTYCYDNGESIIIEILAINGLFQLMQKRNLEYPQFYEKLYDFFKKPEILSNKYRSRFFRLVDLFLSSTHLPASIVASFIKRMARLAIFNNPGGIVIVMPFIYNLLKKHPSCMILIHNPLLSDEELENYEDPFNNDETDPLLTNAIESSLWELETLASHYHPNVATLAKIFSNPFTKTSYNIEDFLDWNYKGLLESERTRRIKGDHMMAIEFEEWDSAFKGKEENEESRCYIDSWRL
ncbi:ribosome biosynthesis protein [Saccharomycopsis crataegensis]|uniref:Ribosome biosynthesis protein n=1 Tax=Saccharomycopsis crataegensis TaxID=43959 RepID=A0AAV5QUH6_9ASCO|nr:ribosome biosynthesis protein [Saccharomycopsis crataegensis]